MEIKDKYIKKYWYNMVLDQLVDEYESSGYVIDKECRLSENSKYYCADLVVKKDGEKTIIEILHDKSKMDQTIRLRKFACDNGYDFKIVYANFKPLQQTIEFEDFPTLFVEYLNNDIPSELGEFASHVRVEDVVDVEYRSIDIQRNSVCLTGSCNVELETWTNDEDDTTYTYYVPCSFVCELSVENDLWTIQDESRLDINTNQLDK